MRVWDTKQDRLHARALPGGSVTLAIRYRNEIGTQRVLRLGKWKPHHDWTATRKAAADALGKIQGNGVDLVAVRRAETLAARRAAQLAKASTLGNFLEHHYFPLITQTHVSHEPETRAMRKRFKCWWSRPMDSLKPSDITLWKASNAEIAPATRNRLLSYLKAALNVALKEELILRNPLADWGTKDSTHRREFEGDNHGRELTSDEEARLLSTLRKRDADKRARRVRTNDHRQKRHKESLPKLPQHFVDHVEPLIITLLHSGMRWGEAAGLRWSEVDFDSGFIRLPAEGTKARRMRSVPIADPLMLVLQKTWEQRTSDELCFPSPRTGNVIDNINKAFKAVKRDAEIAEPFRIHDFRHTCARRWLDKGVSVRKVAAALGHGTTYITERYLGSPDEADLRELVA